MAGALFVAWLNYNISTVQALFPNFAVIIITVITFFLSTFVQYFFCFSYQCTCETYFVVVVVFIILVVEIVSASKKGLELESMISQVSCVSKQFSVHCSDSQFEMSFFEFALYIFNQFKALIRRRRNYFNLFCVAIQAKIFGKLSCLYLLANSTISKLARISNAEA